MSIEIVEILPLSPLQQGFLFHMLYDTEQTDSYHVQQVFELKGALDGHGLKDAAAALLQRHPNLAAGFEHEETDAPLQIILKGLPLPWFEYDLSALTAEQQTLALQNILREDYQKRFDPQDPPLLRFTLIKLNERLHQFVLTNHHILLDGWSVPVLLTELFELYRSKGDSLLLPPAAKFRDYLQWISQRDVEVTRQVWRQTLQDVKAPTLLAGGRGIRHFQPQMITRHLDEKNSQKLTELARRLGVTVNTVIQAAWGLMLAMMTSSDDVIFGITVSGRPPELSGVERMIGLLINTVPLRLRFKPNETVEDLLQRLQAEQSDLLEHQYYDLLKIQQDAGFTELFDTLVVYENYPQVASQDNDEKSLAVEMVSHRGGDASHYPLGLMAVPGKRFTLTISALPECFEAGEAEAIVMRFIHILSAVINGSDRPIAEIDWLTAPEQQFLLNACNDTAQPVIADTLAEQFVRQVNKTPQAIAISEGARQLSYQQLNVEANRLAYRLIELGVSPDDRIAILLDRSIELIIAILAVIKAGGGYMPLRRSDPLERQQWMADNAGTEFLITDIAEAAPDVRQVIIINDNLPLPPQAQNDPAVSLSPSNLAYVMYTSGSTGQPKGIAITHSNVVALAHDRCWRNAHHRRVLLHASHAFDASTYEIWVPLLQGGEIVVVPAGDTDIDLLGRLIVEKEITTAFLTTGLFRLVVEQNPDCLKTLGYAVTGGDVLPKATVQRIFQHCPNVTVVNGYGPTEITTFATVHKMQAPFNELHTIPIGKPQDNMQVYVLDRALRPVPAGITGELYIAGSGLARGYLNQRALTAERFVADPFGQPGQRMYRSGDMVRWRKDGLLEFIGRMDDLVKIRGFRIELGEIETVLQSHPAVAQAVVTVRQDQRQNKQLAAYIVVAEGQTAEIQTIRQWAIQQLPDFMVPAAMVILPALPLTANGKIDLKALPEPVFSLTEMQRPRNQQEELLCSLFAGVLGLENVGIYDDFFDLGGHSLLATALISNIRKTLGVEIKLRALFDAPTVAELAQCLATENKLRPALKPQLRGEYPPLSSSQQRLWLLDRIDGQSDIYNIPLALRLTGELDYQSLQKSIDDLMARHEILRTVYRQQKNGQVYQHILDYSDCPLERISVTPSSLPKALLDKAGFVFNLAENPPIKAFLFEIDEQQSVLLLLLHHIAGDGASIAPMLSDLARSYNAYRSDRQPEQTPLAVQFADYALWQRQLLGDESDADSLLAQQAQYWRKRLAGMPDELNLPFDRPRSQNASYRGQQVAFSLEPEVYQRLQQLARSEGVTLFMILQAALTILLHRLGGGDDIILGTPIAGRTDEKLSELIGYFANTLVLRTDLSADPDVHQLLKQIRNNTLDAYAHQDIPFEKLVELLNPVRSLARHPLFQVMLVLQNQHYPTVELDGLVSRPESILLPTAKFDLTFNFEESFGSEKERATLEGRIEYACDLFNPSTVERMANYLISVVKALIEQPERQIKQIQLLSEAERTLLLNQWNPTSQPTISATLIERFERQVAERPQAIALSADGVHLSYDALNRKANRLARCLRDRNVGSEDIVALALPRSADMIVALLAILKTGAAYLPLDPNYPQERIAFILQDAKPLLVITDSQTSLPTMAESQRLLMDSDTLAELIAQQSEQNLTQSERIRALTPDTLAYIIYTSGSTGNPKGVQITHHNVSRLFTATEREFNFDHNDVWTMFHSYAFDFSVWEIWGPLLYGGRLVVVPYLISRSPTEFLQLLVDEQVTVLNQTPSAFYQLIYADQNNPEIGDKLMLRQVIFGGEALDFTQLAQWYERHNDNSPQLVNMYGITETTVHVSYQAIDKRLAQRQSKSVIGGAISDLKIYVLDEALQPTPIGVKGEMYIAGEGLARGYFNRADLTAERFVADPFGKPGDRMYRSGDLAMWGEEATLCYLGRSDHQVKIRGFRIELAEIELAIAGYDDIAKAVVITRQDQHGNDRLIGYVTSESGQPIDINALRLYLRGQLPDYMLPSAIVQVDAFSLTANGKLDRRALPMPEATIAQGRRPTTEIETALHRLFCETLSVESISIDDSFFDLGGHSLLAVKLIDAIQRTMAVDVSIRTLFEAPTVAELANSLTSAKAGDPLDVLLPLKTSGSASPLFCFHPASGVSWPYAGLIPYVGKDRPIYGLQSARFTSGISPESIEHMAENYLQHIRKVQPHGPYALLGWSFGCHVAHRVAERLEQLGESVEKLIFLDGYPLWQDDGDLEVSESDMLHAIRQSLAEQGTIQQIHSIDELRILLNEIKHPLAGLETHRFEQILLEFKDVKRLLKQFIPGTFNGNMLFFKAGLEPDPNQIMDPMLWQSYVSGDIEVYSVASEHQKMLSSAAIELIGPILAEKLSDVD